MISRFQRTGVAVLVQHSDVAEEVNVPAPVCLERRTPRAVLSALAVADVDVLDTLNHRSQRRDGVLTRAIDVAGVHVQPERR